MAVRDQVFSGKLSQQELASGAGEMTLRAKREALRLMLANRIAKYGNDDDSVDDLLVRAYQTFIDEIGQFHNTRYGRGPIGGGYYAGTSLYLRTFLWRRNNGNPGWSQSAFAISGRASPSSGTDSHGPTAVLTHWVNCLQQHLGGVLLNQNSIQRVWNNHAIARN